MPLSIRPQPSQYYLVAVSFGVAFCAWNVADSGRYCSSPRMAWPVLSSLIFVGWLILCAFQTSNTQAWSWRSFSISAFWGGGVLAVAAMLFGLGVLAFDRSTQGEPIRGLFYPLALFAPYAVVSGLWGQRSSSAKAAALNGVLALLAQMAVDFVLSLPVLCVY
jgi:hypothetical protein